jgi:hypothetical protein
LKLRILKLTPQQLAGLLLGKAVANASKLPSDLEVLDAKVDLFTGQVSIVVRSDSFEHVSESLPIPELISDVTAATTSTVEAKPLMKPAVYAAKVELKPETGPTVAKPPQPPVSRYAAKMENEFSPDQRKLLSFSVKDDYVIVKPVSFLKEEWDDINEVVRSLHGRWVKGAIISYWEIPLQ